MSNLIKIFRQIFDVLIYFFILNFDLFRSFTGMLVVATWGTGYVLGSGNVVDLARLCCSGPRTIMVANSAN